MSTEAFEFRHVVGLEETNALGNVYFTNYFLWQGRCRELFLHDYAPTVISGAPDEAVVTTRASCEYLSELQPFDEVVIRMRLGESVQNRLSLLFEYWQLDGEHERLVARGHQELAWLKREGENFVPQRVPAALIDAVDRYRQDVGERSSAVAHQARGVLTANDL